MTVQFTPWTVNLNSVVTRIFAGDCCIADLRLFGSHKTANANLMAAAPDLYEALGALLAHPKISGCRPVSGDLTGNLFGNAEAALAKARGDAA